MSAAAPATDRPTAAKLIMPRSDAIKHLQMACGAGEEIKARRIRNGDDLDEARGIKLQWVSDSTDLLNQLFDNVSVADYFNDWVGKVFPEYAEFGNFVEQFYEEMDHRLSKLRAVLKRVEEAPDNVGATPSEGAAAPAHAAPEKPEKQEKPAAEHSKSSGKQNKSPQQHAQTSSSPNTESAMPSAASNKVLFVSHGPKDPSSEAVLQFVQQLSMAVLEADHTNGLIDTLEGQKDMGFVIVMNAADHVENGKASLSDNSVFKLGYCAGKLGLKRMCMMNGPTHPSVAGDSQGITHVTVDPNGGWQLHLARQMKRAGCDIDLNRLA
jgi:predicted nucleotide-binding protein